MLTKLFLILLLIMARVLASEEAPVVPPRRGSLALRLQLLPEDLVLVHVVLRRERHGRRVQAKAQAESERNGEVPRARCCVALRASEDAARHEPCDEGRDTAHGHHWSHRRSSLHSVKRERVP